MSKVNLYERDIEIIKAAFDIVNQVMSAYINKGHELVYYLENAEDSCTASISAKGSKI